MKIGIIGSSVDILILFRFLNKHKFVYTYFFDQEGGDRSEKNSDFVLQRVERILEISKERGIDTVILPPLIELYFLQHEKWKDYIFPLFKNYLLEECLPFSRVGKIGIIGDYFDLQKQQLLKDLCHIYELTDIQKAIKKFHKPFAFRSKQVRMWKYFLAQLGWKNWMMHNVIKRDLRSIIDAGVDTIIPCNYGYFAYDVTIHKLIRTKKMRRYGLDTLEKVFNNVYTRYDINSEDTKEYQINIVYTGHLDFLLNEKKLVWLLQRGKKSEVKTEKLLLND